LGIEITFEKRLKFDGSSLPLAKLHGSADTTAIVAPTWNKSLNKQMKPVWAAAQTMLSQANHLRIIGYSLPRSDSYVQYLLKSAVTSSPHLKTIDVICFDESGSVKERFNEFVRFPYYRFVNARSEVYLRMVFEQHRTVIRDVNRNMVIYDRCEEAHEAFINNPAFYNE
jgi:hypothetical protein